MTVHDIDRLLGNLVAGDRITGDELAELHDLLTDAGREVEVETLNDAFRRRDGNFRDARVLTGWLFTVTATENDPTGQYLYEDMDGQTVQVGFHGNDVPPCRADYVGDAGEDGWLVLHDEPVPPACIAGWTATPAPLQPGERRHDGCFGFMVIARQADGQVVLLGDE